VTKINQLEPFGVFYLAFFIGEHYAIIFIRIFLYLFIPLRITPGFNRAND
jgi:hypothetical protein